MNKENIKEVEISICGKTFSINTDEKEETLTQAAKIVDSLVTSISGRISLDSKDTKIAILVALQLATDLTKKQEVLNSFKSESKELVDLLTA